MSATSQALRFFGGLVAAAMLIAATPCMAAGLVHTAHFNDPTPGSVGGGTSIIRWEQPGTLSVYVRFDHLSSRTTDAAFHCCGALGVDSPIALSLTGFPSATDGSYWKSFNLSDADIFSTAFLQANGGTAESAAEALRHYFADGVAYLAINTENPNLTLSAPIGVPEPSTWAAMIIGFGLAGAALRRQRDYAAA